MDNCRNLKSVYVYYKAANYNDNNETSTSDARQQRLCLVAFLCALFVFCFLLNSRHNNINF